MRVVGLLVYEGMRLFDAAVALEVWGVDRSAEGVPRFDVRICGHRRRAVRCAGSARMEPTHGLSGLRGVDVLIVPGRDDPAHQTPPSVLAALATAHRKGVTIAALCGGTFLLAQAGLLDGRRATTHWLHADLLRAVHPSVVADTGQLFLEDGGCWTSAGTAAGIDLCLHLVSQAHGAAVAAAIGRRMVIPPHRRGDERQFVQQPIRPTPDRGKSLAATLAWGRGRLHEPLSVRGLARHAGISERTLARRFAESTGTTPLAWITQERIQLARELLEATELPVDVVARTTGFGSALSMRRHFQRHLDVTPATYRRQQRRLSAANMAPTRLGA